MWFLSRQPQDTDRLSLASLAARVRAHGRPLCRLCIRNQHAAVRGPRDCGADGQGPGSTTPGAQASALRGTWSISLLRGHRALRVTLRAPQSPSGKAPCPLHAAAASAGGCSCEARLPGACLPPACWGLLAGRPGQARGERVTAARAALQGPDPEPGPVSSACLVRCGDAGRPRDLSGFSSVTGENRTAPKVEGQGLRPAHALRAARLSGPCFRRLRRTRFFARP